jgi:branched-chain amino acid transport system substrate-binding protein
MKSFSIYMRLTGVCLLAAALLPAAFAQTGGVYPDRIVIHHIGPLSGVLAVSNKESLDGADLYFSQVNARGGVAGRRVVMERLDDKQDAKLTAEIFKAEIAAKKILTMFMPRTTPSIQAAIPIAEESDIPMIAPQTGGAAIAEPPKREVFAIRATYQSEAEEAIELQHSMGVRRFGLLVAGDAFGKDTMEGVNRQTAKLNIKPVAQESIDNRNPDVKQAVATMLAAKPDVVMMIVSSKAASDFVKGYKAGGGFSTFVTLSNTSNNDYVKGLGEHSRGAVVMQVIPSPFSPTTQIARDYVAAAAKEQKPISYAGLQGFISAKVLVEALRKAGRSPTPDSLIQAMEGLGTFDTGGFIVKFGPKLRAGSSFVEASMISRDGRFMR